MAAIANFSFRNAAALDLGSSAVAVEPEVLADPVETMESISEVAFAALRDVEEPHHDDPDEYRAAREDAELEATKLAMTKAGFDVTDEDVFDAMLDAIIRFHELGGPRAGRSEHSPPELALVPRRFWRDWARRRLRELARLLQGAIA